MALVFNAVIGGLLILYPIAVYFSIQHFEPWIIAAFLLALLVIRFLIVRDKGGRDNQWNQLLLLLGIAYCLFAIWLNTSISLLFYPVLVSYCLLLIFFSSLYIPPPIVERLARLQHPDLPEQGVRYTRTVTQVWCVFFFINGSIALATALWGDFVWWSLYNGFISYLLMATVMGVEYVVRIRTQVHLKEQTKASRQQD